MTPIDQQLREKWEKEARQYVKQNTLYGKEDAPIGSSARSYFECEFQSYLAACEARHREYQERVATLTEAATDVLTLIDFGLPLDEIDKKKIEQLRAALSPPPAKQQEP